MMALPLDRKVLSTAPFGMIPFGDLSPSGICFLRGAMYMICRPVLLLRGPEGAAHYYALF
jgi:hypothetical protein